MFEEAQLYSPVTEDDDGTVTVHLADDHPGKSDPDYQERRNAIAAAALEWSRGEPIPRIAYNADEQEVWRTVQRELAPKHDRYACRAFREAKAALALPADRIPQLDEVTAGLEPLTGFHYVPAAGIVPVKEFYGNLADREFHSTQYIRHPSAPLYTPEPDLIHEVIGHGQPAGRPGVRRAQPAGGRGGPAGGDRGGRAVRRRRVLVHDRVRRRLGGRRAARLRRGHPLQLRRDRGVPRDGDPPAGLPPDGDDRVRHHPLPAGAVRGRVEGSAGRRARGVLRRFTDETPQRLALATSVR